MKAQLHRKDCLELLKTLPDNSIDAIVTDPPYFLTNSSGSGFMGKEWDSLSVKNAFAEAVLKSLKPVFALGVENTAPENASTNSKGKKKRPTLTALYVQSSSIGAPPKLSHSTFSVLENVLTREEVLALCSGLSPLLISVIESQPEIVLYVVPVIFTEKQPRGIAQELALRLHTASVCEEIETLHSLMADPKTKALIEEMAGRKYDSQFIKETALAVESAESIVLEKRYNATTSSPIDYLKTIQWATSLPSVRAAMAKFTAIPGNIQLLSENFHYNWLVQCLRVLKPGGHMISFAGTRTYHRLARAVEDSGFEIRDLIQWNFGSGFPKSHNLEGKWKGWGTALKPANEPAVLARKPLEKGLTVAQNVQKWGTGAINVDGCRVESSESTKRPLGSVSIWGKDAGDKIGGSDTGRWPANLILDEEAAAALDEQTGDLGKSTGGNSGVKGKGKDVYKFGSADNETSKGCGFGDSGGASRFFYVAKASKSERNKGLEGRVNGHPTVKPTKLMSYLCRLITPPKGTVLDPFMGSGSTGVAALREGFKFRGIEISPEYFEIAKKRVTTYKSDA